MRLSIEKQMADATTLILSGRLDTTTAPELEKQIDALPPETTALILDMQGLEYISSAGLRVLLKTQKMMNKKGTLKLVHVPEMVMEVLDITGFADFLTIV
ncbi:STAS domain-containing protein [Butyricicoccus sp.]|uniref:STAS domain-containing protein n=1 Tax=Butyricicoccus sp. TaxID=2049021 RepID=UPI003D7D8061